MSIREFDERVTEIEHLESKTGFTLRHEQVSQVRSIVFREVERLTGIDLKDLIQRIG